MQPLEQKQCQCLCFAEAFSPTAGELYGVTIAQRVSRSSTVRRSRQRSDQPARMRSAHSLDELSDASHSFLRRFDVVWLPLELFWRQAQLARPSAPNATAPRLAHCRVADVGGEGLINSRYVSAASGGVVGRGRVRPSGWGIQRVMYANDSELQTGQLC
jgi:hypothetical protein